MYEYVITQKEVVPENYDCFYALRVRARVIPVKFWDWEAEAWLREHPEKYKYILDLGCNYVGLHSYPTDADFQLWAQKCNLWAIIDTDTGRIYHYTAALKGYGSTWIPYGSTIIPYCRKNYNLVRAAIVRGLEKENRPLGGLGKYIARSDHNTILYDIPWARVERHVYRALVHKWQRGEIVGAFPMLYPVELFMGYVYNSSLSRLEAYHGILYPDGTFKKLWGTDENAEFPDRYSHLYA